MGQAKTYLKRYFWFTSFIIHQISVILRSLLDQNSENLIFFLKKQNCQILFTNEWEMAPTKKNGSHHI